jgi:hypothetical protein
MLHSFLHHVYETQIVSRGRVRGLVRKGSLLVCKCVDQRTDDRTNVDETQDTLVIRPQRQTKTDFFRAHNMAIGYLLLLAGQ